MGKKNGKWVGPRLNTYLLGPGGWRPESANYYVYLNNLLETGDSGLYNEAKDNVTVGGKQISLNEMQTHFSNAMNFLHSAELNELKKERAMLAQLRENTPNLSKIIEMPSDDLLNFDYLNFIRKLNKTKQDIRKYMARLEDEKKRLNNPNIKTFTNKKGEEQTSIQYSRSPTQSALPIERHLLDNISGRIQNSKGRKTDIRDFVYNNIFIDVGSAVGFNVNFSSHAHIAFSSLLATEAEEYLKEGATQEQILEALKKDPEYQRILKMLKDADFQNKNSTHLSAQKEINELGEKMFTELGFQPTKKNAKNMISYKDTKNSASKKLEEEIRKINDDAIDYFISRKKDLYNITTISLKDDKGRTINPGKAAEWSGLALGEMIMGGKQRPTDTMHLTLSAEIQTNSNAMDFLSTKMKEIENINFYERKDYNKLNEALKEKYKEMDDYLTALNTQVEYAEKAFLAHGSVKDYIHAGRGTGFSGGTGWKIDELLNVIQAGGFSGVDIEWLRFALLNVAPGAVGSSNRGLLETYLSTFAAFLLFDDGIFMMEEITKNLSFPSLSTCHLFRLNNALYVPVSYVLNLIQSQMLQAYLAISSNQVSKIKSSNFGANAKIHTITNFKKRLSDLSEAGIFKQKRWDTFREQQLNGTEIKIQFLGSFLNLINNL